MKTFEVNALSNLIGFENEEEKFEFQKEILSLKFVKVIENYLNQNKISKKDFAKSTGYSQSYVSQVFCAHKYVNMDFLVKSQNALELPFDVKLGDYNCSPMDIVYNSRHNTLKSKNKYSPYQVDYSVGVGIEEQLEG